MKKNVPSSILIPFLIMFFFATTFLGCIQTEENNHSQQPKDKIPPIVDKSKIVRVFIMAGQSNMEGHNTPPSRLHQLVDYAKNENYDIPSEELTDIFTDTVLTHYNNATVKDPDSPVVKKLESFLYKTEVLSPPPDTPTDFDYTDRAFRTISQYYYNGSNYAYEYDAYKIMSSAMGLNQVKKEGKLSEALFSERNDVTVISHQGRLNPDGTRSFSSRHGKLKNSFGANSDQYGPELMFGTFLGDTLKENILLLKVVQGGTDLRVAWRSPDVEKNSNNNYTSEELTQESLYDSLLVKVNELKDPEKLSQFFPEYVDKTIKISGFIWFQGWNDGFNPINKREYETNFNAFLKDLRNDLKDPDLPITVIQSHVGEPDEEVQSAQAKVVHGLDKAALALSDDLSGYYHFDSSAHLVIGHRAFNAMEPLIEKIPDGSNPQWEKGPGSDAGSTPLAYLHQRYKTEDISGYNAQLSIIDTSGEDDFFIHPEFNKKEITVNFKDNIFLTSPNVTFSFKFQPDELGQNHTLLSSDHFFSITQEATDEVTSTYYDQGSAITTVTNGQSQLKNHSGNHVAAILGENYHTLYFNGVPIQIPVDSKLIRGQRAISFTIGPFPGKIWDIKIHNRALSEPEIMEDAKYFTDGVYKPSIAPNPDFPNGLVGVYRSEWWPLDSNLEPGESVIPLKTYEYYLVAQERAVKYAYFAAKMVPIGKEKDYIGLKPNGDLILSNGIRNRFVRSFSFENPQNVHNSDYWLHENFHSYQGPLKVPTTKWFLEATASWFPDIIFPGSNDTLMAYYTMAPHMPLWITQNGDVDDLAGWQYKGGHQYGAGIFLWYLTTYVDNTDLIGKTFNHPTLSNRPQEAIYHLLGDDPDGTPKMRKAFGDFASRTVTWDYEAGDLLKEAEQAGLRRIMNAKKLPLEEADNRFPTIYDSKGTGNNWILVPTDHKPGSWGYNAYKCEPVASGHYKVEFKADPSNVTEAFYELRVVIHNETSGERTYYDLSGVENNQTVSIENIATNEGNTLYLIVATTPDKFSDDTIRYSYSYKIFKQK